MLGGSDPTILSSRPCSSFLSSSFGGRWPRDLPGTWASAPRFLAAGATSFRALHNKSPLERRASRYLVKGSPARAFPENSPRLCSSRSNVGTPSSYRRSIQMSERTKRSVLRRVINDRLYQFHRALLVWFASDAKNFLERLRLSSMRCPACGGQMALTRTITTFNPRETENVFACVRCALSYLTEDHIPVNGRAVI
jgi:hypothetical protein